MKVENRMIRGGKGVGKTRVNILSFGEPSLRPGLTPRVFPRRRSFLTPSFPSPYVFRSLRSLIRETEAEAE